MSFWGKIKKEVSRFGDKMNFDRSRKAWSATIAGTTVGTVAGGIGGAIATGGNPGGIAWGAVAGGVAGYAAGSVAGDQLDAIDSSNERTAKLQEQAISMASRVEGELSSNNTEDAALNDMERERRARLAASYSLSATRGVFNSSKTSAASGRRSTLG